ncbi:MFS transporter [Streptomyces sp. B3I8]|uniref:MFS transporter n=1 Tax=Streptomyces sp. B3I8 TaxID=3042303 RepID=UPI0027D8B5F5|nr:MFS transporter [Streptomyces sp. B3I8]
MGHEGLSVGVDVAIHTELERPSPVQDPPAETCLTRPQPPGTEQLGLRLASGPLADRSRRFWAWTIAGYVLTAATVPVLGLTGVLWVACTLVIAERVGKAVRSPAKDTLLSHATAATGRGRGFAVHEAMDQVGALIGPLTVAGVLALTGGDYAPALGVLALPGVAAVALLLWLRARVPIRWATRPPSARRRPSSRLPPDPARGGCRGPSGPTRYSPQRP